MKNLVLLLTVVLPTLTWGQTKFVFADNSGHGPHPRLEQVSLEGDSVSLFIDFALDSVSIQYQKNTYIFSGASCMLEATSPTTQNRYLCLTYGSIETATIVEFSYNATRGLWALCITIDETQVFDGGHLWRPFPPLRVIKPPKPPTRPSTHGRTK